MRSSRTLTVLLGLMAILSCQPKSLTPEEYRTYLYNPDKGLVQRADAGGYHVESLYSPVELLVLQDLEEHDKPSKQQLDSLKNAYGSQSRFLISITYKGQNLETAFAPTPTVYQQVQRYLQQFHQHAVLTTEQGHSYKATDSFYLSSYGHAGDTKVLVFFEPAIDQLKDDFYIEMNHFPVADASIRLTYKIKDLQRIPSITF